MKTAEEIIQEYLARGYSPESLRILAESREQPLSGEMLALIDELEASAVPADSGESVELEVPCETGSYARVGEDMVFFVAEDADAADGEAVDFDVMAETAEAEEIPAEETPAEALEESVADIVIEESAEEPEPEMPDDTVCVDYLPGAAVLPLEPEQEPEVMEVQEEVPETAAVARREKRRRKRQEKKLARQNTVNILTCADVVPAEESAEAEPPVSSETLALLSAHAFTLANSFAALSREELSKAAALIEENKTAGEESFEEETNENNIILFSDNFETFDEEELEAEKNVLSLVGEEEENEDAFEPVLRVLPAPESELALVNSCDIAEDTVEQLLAEEPETEEPVAEEIPEESAEEPEEVLDEVVEEPEPDASAVAALEEMLERETALRLELEADYQTRLDAFAARILEARTAVAAQETKYEEKKAELDARSAVLAEMQQRLAAEEEKQKELLQQLENASSALQSKDGDFARFEREHAALKDEHAQLYSEFEDLRKSYNEVVSDVMPQLQTERDELAVTVERQCEKEKALRTNLAASRKRLAAGYILGAAACLMLVTLPVANWLRSGDDNRQLAVDRQQFSELRETLSAQMSQNVQAQTRIVELERKITRARDEITKLDGRNKELAAVAAAQHSQGIAVFKPEAASASGTPTRAVTMALQATTPPGGKLRVNEVMDPAGSIEQLAMVNSGRNPAPLGAEGVRTEMASARSSAAPLQVSAVARTDAGSLRPMNGGKGTKTDTVTGVVKKGEGVAQVVYRVLNTRDPEVIAWVIEENNIRSDRRGNPIIQPNQKLRLPADGRAGQTAMNGKKP